MLKKPVISRSSPGRKLPATSHFTSWSASTSSAAAMNQGTALRMLALLPCSLEVADAAAAQALAVDVGAVVPAALAFRMAARADSCLAVAHARRRGEEHVLEVLAQ